MSSKKLSVCWQISANVRAEFDIDELEALHQELEARIASLSDSVSNAREERMALRREQEQLQSRIQSLMQRAPVWLAAQNSLNQLSEQCGEEFTSSRDVTEFLQQLLEREREAIVERDEVGARKTPSMKRSNV